MGINNFNIDYAVEIDSGTTETIPELGMVDGVIKFITGRPEGTLVYENDSEAKDFNTGFLIKDPIKGLSKTIDVSVSGNFSSLNNISVTISNINNYEYVLRNNNIFLTNSIIRVYCVLNNKLYNRWAGTISETIRDTTKFTIKARDYNESFFKTIPVTEDEQIALGDVSYLKLKKEGNRDVILIDSAPANKYFETVDNDGNPRTSITLYITRQEWIDLKEDQYKDFFIRSRQFGTPLGSDEDIRESNFDESIRILGNSDGYIEANKTFDNYDRFYYLVDLYLEKNFQDLVTSDCVSISDYDNTNKLSPFLLNGPSADAKFVFDVIDIKTKYIISQDQVENIETDENGNPITYVWDDDTEKYLRINSSLSFTNDASGAYIVLSNNSEDLRLPTADYIYPVKAFRTEHSFKYSNEQWSSKGDREEIFNLKSPNIEKLTGGTIGDPDRSRFQIKKHTYSTIRAQFVPYSYVLELQFPDDFNFNSYDNVYLGTVVKIQDRRESVNDESILGYDGDIMFNIHDVATDEYLDLRTPPDWVDSRDVYLTNPPTNECYFRITEEFNDDDLEYTQFYKDTREYEKFKGVMICTDNPYYNDAETRWTSEVKRAWKTYYKRNANHEYVEIDQDFKESMSISNYPFVSIPDRPKNTMFMSIEWDKGLQGSVERQASVNSASLDTYIYNIHLIGEKTVTSEDVYVKVKGETVDDAETNNVYNTFKYLFQTVNGFTPLLMDYDNLPETRTDWDCSRVIYEKKSSKSYITDLARQSFVGIYTNRFGNFALSSWREKETVDYVHNNETTNNLSIKNVSQISSNKVYNDITLNYNKIYATNKFKYTMFVTNTDQPTWDVSYSNISDEVLAEGWWNTCNDSFNKNKVLQNPTKDLVNCEWYFDPQEFNDDANSVIDSSVYYYLTNLITWNTQQKSKITYSIPINEDTIKIELLDTVVFNDDWVSNGNDIFGWVVGYTIDMLNSEIKIDLMVESEFIQEPFDVIDEDTPDISSIIDEDDSQTTDIIEEDDA